MAIDYRLCTVVLHDDLVSSDDTLCGKEILAAGEVAYITAVGARPLCVTAQSPAVQPDEVSIHVSIARRFGFENRTQAVAEVLEDVTQAVATHIELLFREQHLLRADMWHIKSEIEGAVLHRGQQLTYLGTLAAEVTGIYIAGRSVDSAIVSHPSTKLIFRSGSASYTFLIQVSKEMLESRDGPDINHEILTYGFFPELFSRWQSLKVRHQVSIILFGRRSRLENSISRDVGEETQEKPAERAPDDFFHVVASNMPSTQWRDLVSKVRQTFNDVKLPRGVSLASKGNMIEAINLAATDFADDDIDPHLSSTGTSIVAITGGSGLFAVDHSSLRHTTQLLLGNGIGVDIVSLSPKPLHPVPLFQYRRDDLEEFALPHWVDISYWTPRRNQYVSNWLLPRPSHQVRGITIPLLGDSISDSAVTDRMELINKGVFDASTRQRTEVGGHTASMKAGSGPKSSVTFDKEVQAVVPPMGRQPNLGEGPLTLDDEFPGAPSSANVPSIQRAKREGLPRHPWMQSSRKISLGPKGLAITQGKASTTVSVQHAQYERDQLLPPSSNVSGNASALSQQIRASLRRRPSQHSIQSFAPLDLSEITKPINIQTGQVDAGVDENADPASVVEKAVMDRAGQTASGDASLSATPKSKRGSLPVFGMGTVDIEDHSMNPWLTLLNPCNPRRENMRIAAEYRKWQNVFPRAVVSGAFKWDSMCHPASLPLTTESRVSITDLEKFFDKKIRRLLATPLPSQQFPVNRAQQIVVRLIAMRLSAGFQIVPTRRLKHAKMPSDSIERILLCLTGVYHEIRCLSEAEVQVTEYKRRASTENKKPENTDTDPTYSFSFRGPLSRKSQPITFALARSQTVEDWAPLDDQSVNSAGLTDSLGTRRMRFVLIPVDFPSPAVVTGPAQLSEEERRIDGIQKLTLLWQRHRLVSEEDQRHQTSMLNPKMPSIMDRDPNPLAIQYETRDPSALVRAQGSGLTGQTAEGDLAPSFFAESDLYHTSNFDLGKLVKHLQEPPPNGVEVKDRRWSIRQHLKCFRGDEMTNWLLRVFKDLETREDAVALGNELMDRDIFTHVRGKHVFRDGNYFYQIMSSHRTSDYPDTAGFFTKGPRSMPATPSIDVKSSPGIRPLQGDSSSSGKGTPTPTMRPVDKVEKRDIVLSRKLQYRVNAGKKSSQLEIINLHYDRIHNPENCYHVHLDWTSTTERLIRDSIARWASVVESHGLRLAQVPLAEASKYHLQHPFNQPLPVRLAIRPPSRGLFTPHLGPDGFNSRSAQTPADTNAHHKILLRRSGFVLDLEAAKSFPRKFNISYSWGKLDYDFTQYIHKSGLVLAQIVNDGEADFLLLPNPLASHVSSMRDDDVTPTSIFRDFKSLCKDPRILDAIFEETNVPNSTAATPFSAAVIAADSDVPPIELPPHLNAGSTPGVGVTRT